MKRQGWLFGFLALTAVLGAGCAKDNSASSSNGSNGWSSFPVTIYADASVSSNSGALSDLNTALNFWEGKVGKTLFNFQGTWSGEAYTGTAGSPGTILSNVVFLQNPWPYNSDYAGLTTVDWNGTQINGAVVMINADITMCSGDCAGAAPGTTSQLRAITHEIGHFLGLQHVTDTSNIMYPVIQPGSSLDDLTVDQATLDSLTAAAN